jgi:hypothetical protein
MWIGGLITTGISLPAINLFFLMLIRSFHPINVDWRVNNNRYIVACNQFIFLMLIRSFHPINVDWRVNNNIIGLKRNTPNAKHPAKHCSWRGVAI